MSIRLKIIGAILATNIVIISFAIAAGSAFVKSNIDAAQETDLTLAAVITDQFISSALDALKLKAVEASFVIGDYEKAKLSGTLEDLHSRYPNYIGAAVINKNGEIIGTSGDFPAPSDIVNDIHIKQAFDGERVISSTIPTINRGVVFYLAVPMPRNPDEILVITLPGMYFSELLSDVAVWDTGYIFMIDYEGYIIANRYEERVQNRVNYVKEYAEYHDEEIRDRAELFTRLLAGESGVDRFRVEGASRLCAFQPITGSQEGWILGVIAPLESSPFRYIDNGLIVVGIVSLGISIIVAIIAAGFIKKPIDEAVKLKETAESNSKFKSEFLANMSHEIRTPMNSIVGFAELALDDSISKKTRNYLSNIHENSEWLLQIINDILDISKIEAGKMVLEKVPFDPHDLVSNCRSIVMPAALDKELELSFYAEPVIGAMPVGDPVRLRQVLVNLLSNAIKFTEAGKIRFTASVVKTQDKSITVHVEVKDTGIGMTEEQIANIFAPFMQAESDTTRKYGGTGLGLAITNNLLELMGSKLQVESIPEVGSKFSFTIKFDTLEITDEERHQQYIAQSTLEKPTFRGDVLLCEDNAMNRIVICEHLIRVGLNCYVAENGKIGVDLVKKRMHAGRKQFDLILMDMHMPEMDGVEATRLIKKMNLDIPIVAITANIMSDDKELYEKSGMDGFVGKPFTSQELWHSLMKFFKPL